jgi:hypothetical protein
MVGKKQIEAMILEQEALRNEIDELAKTKGLWTEDVGPIRDGVADIEAYLQSSPKIMWALKEPYDDFKEDGCPYGGDYTLMEDLMKRRDTKLPKMPLSVQRVIYTTYGIFTGYEYDDMGWYYEPETYKYLFQIAYINLSKMPGGKKSGSMTNKYQIWRDIVLKQIELYNPNVLIFGHTFQYVKEDLGIDDKDIILTEMGWVDIYRKDNRLYVDAYHPGIPGSDRKYVNTIVNKVRQILKS